MESFVLIALTGIVKVSPSPLQNHTILQNHAKSSSNHPKSMNSFFMESWIQNSGNSKFSVGLCQTLTCTVPAPQDLLSVEDLDTKTQAARLLGLLDLASPLSADIKRCVDIAFPPVIYRQHPEHHIIHSTLLSFIIGWRIFAQKLAVGKPVRLGKMPLWDDQVDRWIWSSRRVSLRCWQLKDCDKLWTVNCFLNAPAVCYISSFQCLPALARSSDHLNHGIAVKGLIAEWKLQDHSNGLSCLTR